MNYVKVVLESIERGQATFAPLGDTEEDLRAFQTVAMALDYAADEGLVGKIDLHKSARSGVWLVDAAFVVEGITHKGRSYLAGEEPNLEINRRIEDIVELRPNFMGIGVNLRELWRKYFGV